MSLFSIALRSIQQRGVASLLTMLSMALGVMLVVAVMSIHGVVSQSFKNNASLGYNFVIGAKGGQEQLILNTVFYLSKPVENIPYTYYLEFLKRDQRDRLLTTSFSAEGVDLLRESAGLLSPAGGGMDTAVLDRLVDQLSGRLVPDVTDRKMNAPPIEFGRNGKYGQMTELAIPVCLGDYLGHFRVVGTTPALFNELVYDLENNRKFEFAEGRNFEWHNQEHSYFEAVVGATVARELEIKLGQEISPSHGDPEGHKHARKFTVVGILRPSGTPNDRAVFINMEGFYLMEDHARPVEQAKENESGEPTEGQKRVMTKEEWEQFLADKKNKPKAELIADPQPLPVEQREVTALLLKVPVGLAPGIDNGVNDGNDAQAAMPIAVITRLFEIFIKPVQWTLLALTAMICVVSGISILVSIYNSMSERRGEIAVMRALGAGRGTVMTIILLEATLLALGGGLLGWLAGHCGCLAASTIIEEQTGVFVGFLSSLTLRAELILLPALMLLAILVGLWPAMSAYRTDVAKSLGK